MKVDLSTFQNEDYKPGSVLRRGLWYFTNLIIFNTGFFPFFNLKVFLLKLFGSKTGKNIIIKPNVNIKYPWKLSLGNNVWIGENVWIDNLDDIIIGNNVCISQGATLMCGNHNYKKSTFDLIIKPIILEDGVWIGATSFVSGGVTAKSHAVLTVGSIATIDLEPYSINKGNPAVKIKDRVIVS